MSQLPACYYEGKAIQLLYDCHAVRYPRLHQPMVEYGPVSPEVQSALSKLGYNPSAEMMAEEWPIVSASSTMPERVALIKLRLQPLLRFCLESKPVHLPSALTQFCQLQLNKLESEGVADELYDEAGRELPASFILPPHAVLIFAKSAWCDRNQESCRALKSWISRTITVGWLRDDVLPEA